MWITKEDFIKCIEASKDPQASQYLAISNDAVRRTDWKIKNVSDLMQQINIADIRAELEQDPAMRQMHAAVAFGLRVKITEFIPNYSDKDFQKKLEGLNAVIVQSGGKELSVNDIIINVDMFYSRPAQVRQRLWHGDDEEYNIQGEKRPETDIDKPTKTLTYTIPGTKGPTVYKYHMNRAELFNLQGTNPEKPVYKNGKKVSAMDVVWSHPLKAPSGKILDLQNRIGGSEKWNEQSTFNVIENQAEPSEYLKTDELPFEGITCSMCGKEKSASLPMDAIIKLAEGEDADELYSKTLGKEHKDGMMFCADCAVKIPALLEEVRKTKALEKEINQTEAEISFAQKELDVLSEARGKLEAAASVMPDNDSKAVVEKTLAVQTEKFNLQAGSINKLASKLAQLKKEKMAVTSGVSAVSSTKPASVNNKKFGTPIVLSAKQQEKFNMQSNITSNPNADTPAQPKLNAKQRRALARKESRMNK